MCIGVRAQNLKATVNGAPIEMIEVEGGTFMMGDHMEQRADALPLHEVTLDTYYIGRTEVTQQLWTAVMGYNNSYFKGKYRPVETIDYDEVQAFIIKLNKLTGINFRLLTEAEWEYAATANGYHKEKANKTMSFTSSPSVVRIGLEDPNLWGFYDMTGNVSEYVWDSYAPFTSDAVTDPTGPAQSAKKVTRGGGAWLTYNLDLLYRENIEIGYGGPDTGFRVCRHVK